jgi:two-component system, LytTR family, response regulator LytT
MRVLIIDTIPAEAELLSKTLYSVNPEVTVCAVLSTIQSVFEWLNQYGQPDIVFMEVQLNEGLSFEILNYLNEAVKVVFTLPFNKCTVDVFEKLSVCFLLKPYHSEQVKPLVSFAARCFNRIELYESLLNGLYPRALKKILKRIIVKKGSEYHIVQIADVIYFASENGILYFVTKENQKHMMPGTLRDVYNQLETHHFYRANRNFIVNSSFLKGFRRTGYKITLIFMLPVRDEIYINSYHVSDFKSWLEGSIASGLMEIKN